MKKNIVWLSAAILLLGASCKKTDQPVTKDCTVIGSEWFKPVTDAGSEWKIYSKSVTGGEYYRTEMDAQDITQEVIDKSVILVYATLGGYDESVWPEGYIGLLPTAINISSFNTSEDQWSVSVAPGKIAIRLSNTSSAYPAGGPDSRHAFRYIIVPKNANVTGQKPSGNNPLMQYSEDELRSIPYSELCRMAGLSE